MVREFPERKPIAHSVPEGPNSDRRMTNHASPQRALRRRESLNSPTIRELRPEEARVCGELLRGGLLEELAAPEVRIADHDVRVLTEVKIEDVVQFLANVIARLAARVEPQRRSGVVVERVFFVREPDAVELRP